MSSVVADSHWKIPGLHGSEESVADWIAIKRNILVLGFKSSLTARPNTRSSDFVAPSHANGCAMACSYCYVPRRKGYANPISTFGLLAWNRKRECERSDDPHPLWAYRT